MCRICFIIHLVPPVHGNIFVCGNFGQNGDKYTHRRQVDVVGGLGDTRAHQPSPQGHCSAPQVSPWHWPCHRSMGAAPQALPCIDLSQFASMVMMEWSWIHGSTVMDLDPSNQPWTQLTDQIFTCAAFITTFGSQPRTYDRKVVQSNAG